MPIQSIHHVFIETTDFEAQREFWVNLGFEVTDEWGDEQHRAARLLAGTAELIISESEVNCQEIVFRCDTVEELSALFSTSGKEELLDTPLMDSHWGTKLFRLRDPGGTLFVFEENTSPGTPSG
jgi:catechol 2,3-dioxygenase-like lactoylglutathione lyase family enzyme